MKVLHEGIEQSVDSDLMALRSMLVAGRAATGQGGDRCGLRRDRARLSEELDYYQEAANIEYFRRAWVSRRAVIRRPTPSSVPAVC